MRPLPETPVGNLPRGSASRFQHNVVGITLRELRGVEEGAQHDLRGVLNAASFFFQITKKLEPEKKRNGDVRHAKQTLKSYKVSKN